MNLEGIALYALTRMLGRELTGGQIYKIAMPAPHSVAIALRRRNGTVNVLLEAGAGSPCICLPQRLPENPAEPPAFCMLLRKHLEEGRVAYVEQMGLDRVLRIGVDLLAGGGRIVTRELVVELTGKNSNIIFLRDGVIVDALKHVTPAQNTFRTIRPGDVYMPPPPQDGLNILYAPAEEIVAAIPDLADKKLLNKLVAVTTGIGRATAEQLFAEAKIPPAASILAPRDREHLAEAIRWLQRSVAGAEAPVRQTEADVSYAGALDSEREGKNFSHCEELEETYTVAVSQSNRCQTIFPYAAKLAPQGGRLEVFAELNKALAYALHLEPAPLPERERLRKIVRAEMSRLGKKQDALKRDLEQADAAEDFRIKADTLTANIYRLKQGLTQCKLTSIYSGDMLDISLNPELGPSANAQLYYKRYNKLKRAQEEVRTQQAQTDGLAEYMASVDASLETASTRQELEEIRAELEQAGTLRPEKKKRPRLARSEPMLIKFSRDTLIYVGKNNRQNDYLTFSVGSGRDYWLHVKNIPGSHVLVKTSLTEPEPEAIQAAAVLAAWFSKARSGSQVPVDCAQRRFVKKPSGAKPGFVVYTHQTTYYVTPDEQVVSRYVKI